MIEELKCLSVNSKDARKDLKTKKELRELIKGLLKNFLIKNLDVFARNILTFWE